MFETDARRFRDEAEDCRQVAATLTDLSERNAWLKLADDWTKLARAAERRQSQSMNVDRITVLRTRIVHSHDGRGAD